MEPAPTANISRATALRALALHDALDAARNPTVLAMLVACVFLALVFATVVSGDLFGRAETHAFLMTVVVAITPAFAGSAIALYAMVEERERGVPLTLVGAGVSTAQIAVGKLVAAFVWTLLAEVVLCAVLGFSTHDAVAVLALSVPASLPTLLASLGLGLLAGDQTLTSVMSVPVTVLAVAPILGFMSSDVRLFTCMLPVGPAAEVLRACAGADPLYAIPVAAALMAVWICAGAAFAFWAHRRYAGDIALALDRH